MSGSGNGEASGCMKWLACGCGGCLALILLVVGILTLLTGGVFFTLTRNDAYQMAVERAKHDPRVVEVLGEPLETGIFTSGSVDISNDGGTATLVIPVSGPKGEGRLEVDAIKTGDIWEMRVLTLYVEATGEAIDLLASPPGEMDLPGSAPPPAATPSATPAPEGREAFEATA